MAHELDINMQTGSKAMFSVKETPWHREGVVLADAPSFDEAMTLAGLNFEVGMRPIFVQTADDSTSNFQKSPMGQAVVRLDRNTILSEDVMAVVGNDYQPLQYRDAFGVLEPLLDSGVAHLETGGSLRGGADGWMMVRFDIKDPVVQEVFANEVVPFGLVTNNHGQSKRALVKCTPVRVVCANTLGAALATGDQISIQHRGDARFKLIDAAEQMFGGLVERYRLIAEQYRYMKQDILDVDRFTADVLDVAAPMPAKFLANDTEHLTSKGYDLAVANAEKRRAAITNAWSYGKGHTGDHSAWEAYNGAVEVIDHDAKLYRCSGSRVAALTSGRLVALKSDVLTRLLPAEVRK